MAVAINIKQMEYTACPNSSVNGTRKERKRKKRRYKLTILAFKIIPILHNTLLATFIKDSGNCQERPL
jgi:hypothetical protein